jgi:type II secretory pathway pseudopilin PulG
MPINKIAGAKGESGFTLIDLLFTASLICTLCTMSLPSLMRARGAAQSASALGTVRVVNSSQLSFAVTCGSGFYAPDFPTLGLAPAGSPQAFLPPELSTGASFLKQGYRFSMTGTPLAGAPPTCNGGDSAPGYAIVADPLDATVGIPRFFGSNSDGVIYEHNSTLMADMPEAGTPPMGAPIK